MKILGPHSWTRFTGRQHAPRAAAVLPRRARGPRRAGLRRQGHRLHRPPRRRGCRHRPGHRAGGRAVLDGDDEARCTSASRLWSASCSSTSSAASAVTRRRVHRHRQEGRRSRERPSTQPASDPPRAGQRLRQDRSGRLARGLHAAGVEIVSTGSTAGTIADAGVPVTQSRSSPASPSASTAGSRRCTRACTPASSPTSGSRTTAAARRARHRAVRPRRREPVPVRRDRRLRCGARRVRRADRHRRPGDGPRRREEPRERRGRRLASATPRARRGRGRRLRPRRPRKRLAPRRSRTRPPTTSRSPRGSRRLRARRRRARSRSSSARPGSAPTSLRYGENPHQRAALYDDVDADPGSRRPSSCTARRCRTTTTSTPTPPGARRSTSADAAVRRDHQAREPVRHRGRRRHRRGAPQGARVRPGLRVRRRDRHEPTVTVDDGRAGRRHLHRGHRRARLRAGGARGPQPQEEIRLLVAAGARADRASSAARSAAGCCCSSVDRSTPSGDDPSTWTLATGDAADAATLADLEFAWRACRAVKSNAILLANDGATVGVGMGQVNRVDSAQLAVAARGRPGRRFGRRVRRVLPVPRRPRGARRRRRRAVVQPGGSVRDEVVIEAAQEAGVTMYFTGKRHFFH